MSAHIVAEEQTRHRAVVVQKQWQKKTPLDGDLPADVLQIRRFLFFSTGVCDGGALKIYSSVPLMCFMSQGRALAGPMDSPQYSVECGLTAERGCLDGKTPSTPVHSLWFEQMMSCWSTDRRECKRCVRVRVRVCLHMWGINAFHYPLLQTCITHIFYFIWRRVMFHMLLLWRVYMYICAVNKYFLFK